MAGMHDVPDPYANAAQPRGERRGRVNGLDRRDRRGTEHLMPTMPFHAQSAAGRRVLAGNSSNTG